MDFTAAVVFPFELPVPDSAGHSLRVAVYKLRVNHVIEHAEAIPFDFPNDILDPLFKVHCDFAVFVCHYWMTSLFSRYISLYNKTLL